VSEHDFRSHTSGLQSWKLLVCLFALANFLEVAVVAHFVLFTPAFLHAIGFSKREVDAWTGPISSAAFLIGVWFVPLWGVFADRYGRKPLILRSNYIEVVAMALAAIADGVGLYVFARSLSGLALGNTGLMYASLTETTPRNRVALALGLVNASAPLGALAGGLVGGWVVTDFGVHTLFAVDAVVCLVTAVILTALYRETFTPRPTPPVPAMLATAIRAVIHSPVTATIFVVSFIVSAAFYGAFPYLPVRIAELVGERAAPAMIGYTQGLAGVTTLIGSALWGAIADRTGHRRLLTALMATMPVLWLPLYFAPDIRTLTIGWALLNAISPSIGSLMFTIISLSVPAETRGSILSMIYLPMNLAFIVGPFCASLIARSTNVRAVFLASAVLSLIALLVVMANHRRMGGGRAEAGRETGAGC